MTLVSESQSRDMVRNKVSCRKGGKYTLCGSVLSCSLTWLLQPQGDDIVTPLCRTGSWGLGCTYILIPGLYGSLHLGLLLKDPRLEPEALNASETPGGLILASHSFSGKKITCLRTSVQKSC